MVIFHRVLLSVGRTVPRVSAHAAIRCGRAAILGSQFFAAQHGAVGRAGLFAAVVLFAVEDLLCLLQLILVHRAVVCVFDCFPRQAQSVQQVLVVVSMLTHGNGGAEHGLLAVIAQRAVFLLEPAEGVLSHIQNAVGGDYGATHGVGEHRPLRIHIQTVGEHHKNELAVIGLGHVFVIGNAVTEIQSVKRLIDIHVRRDQPLVVIQKAQTRAAVGI